MKKFYKYGFWGLFFIFLTLLNYVRIELVNSETMTQKISYLNNTRIKSLLSANIIDKRKLPAIDGIDILSGRIKKKLLDESKSLIVLYSGSDCNSCQENELKRLNSFAKKLQKKDLRVFGLTMES